MTPKRAVITAAGRDQRHIPLQTVIDRAGRPRTVLNLLLEEVQHAGIESVTLVVAPGDADLYRDAAAWSGDELNVVVQNEPRGFGHAVYITRAHLRDEPFLLMVSDHLHVDDDPAESSAIQICRAAATYDCSVSAVQATHESHLRSFGAVGGTLYESTESLYQITKVLEKPTPTRAEQELVVPGLRQGRYLCYFGMHVLSPEIMQILEQTSASLADGESLHLSPALDALAARSRYLALEVRGRRYDLEEKFGLLYAQLAVALSSDQREEVLTGLLELLAHSRATDR
jgi:UTP--glucose-1-phosphate uridylyltransferase